MLNEDMSHARLSSSGKSTIEDMPNNSFEFFNYEDRKPFNLWDDPTPTKFYMIFKDKEGNAHNIVPEYLDTRYINNVDLTEPRKAVPQTVVIRDLSSTCNTEYVLKMKFSSLKIMHLLSDNSFTKTYTVMAPCCSACESCTMTDPNALMLELYKAIKLDKEALVTVDLIDESDASIITKKDNEEIFEEIAAWVKSKENAADPKVPTEKLKMKLTVKDLSTLSTPIFGSGYIANRSVWMHVTLNSDQDICKWGTVDKDKSTDPVFSEGAGYDIRYLEYFSAGYTNTDMVYRLSEEGPIDAPMYKADVNKMYYQFSINYDKLSTGGWHQYINPVTTIIAFTTEGDGMATIKSLAEELKKKLKY